VSTAYSLLQLHLSQAELALHKAKNNSYSDQRKEAYQQTLNKLFEAVLNEVSGKGLGLPDKEIYSTYKRHIDFIFKSLEFLDSSTLNQIPYEIVECLNIAMKDWLEIKDKYIIVTSLINDVMGFSFDPSLAFDEAIYSEIKTKYNIEFEERLVQINLPKALSRDYLASVVLYHELGHFIDQKSWFTGSLTRNILDEVSRGTIVRADFDKLIIYLPEVLPNIYNTNSIILSNTYEFFVINNHLAEYFCDLFASQYIGQSSNFYLDYITEKSPRYSYTHPSTTNRVKVVNDFLSSTDNIIVTLLNGAVQAIKAGQQLEKRYDKVIADDFYNLIPLNISSVKELHGVYNTAWEIWLDKQDVLAKSINNANPLKIYKVINNLVEKSIGNYITQNKWNQAQVKIQSLATP
jgi:hypothetical protein